VAFVQRKNRLVKKLGDLRPGNAFRVKFDSKEGFYIVGRTNGDQAIQTPMGKVLAFNIETGRAVFKPMTLDVEQIKLNFKWEDMKNEGEKIRA